MCFLEKKNVNKQVSNHEHTEGSKRCPMCWGKYVGCKGSNDFPRECLGLTQDEKYLISLKPCIYYNEYMSFILHVVDKVVRIEVCQMWL